MNVLESEQGLEYYTCVRGCQCTIHPTGGHEDEIKLST